MTRQLAGRVGLVLLLWLLGGRVGLLVGLAIAAWDTFLRPSPALLLRAALLGFCLLPLAVLLRGLPTKTTVTPLFAGGNLAAHYLAGTALALLVLGILRDVRPAPRTSGPGNGPPPPGAGDLLAPLPAPPAKELPARPDDPADGNGARELRPPAPALPSATHPPLWDPSRRRPGGEVQPAGDDQPGDRPAEEAGTAAPPAVHPPLWDPARKRRSATVQPSGGDPPADTGEAAPERPSLGPPTGSRPDHAEDPPASDSEPEADR